MNPCTLASETSICQEAEACKTPVQGLSCHAPSPEPVPYIFFYSGCLSGCWPQPGVSHTQCAHPEWDPCSTIPRSSLLRPSLVSFRASAGSFIPVKGSESGRDSSATTWGPCCGLKLMPGLRALGVHGAGPLNPKPSNPSLGLRV